jgi:hypothetical protein
MHIQDKKSSTSSWPGVLDTTICDKVCQWLATGRYISLGIPVSSTNKTDRHDITEILLKVALDPQYINSIQRRGKTTLDFYCKKIWRVG